MLMEVQMMSLILVGAFNNKYIKFKHRKRNGKTINKQRLSEDNTRG